jgi:hypothetical protein
MPAVSKAQQKFMGLVHALKKGDIGPEDVSADVEKAADSISDKDAKDFASTKHKGLPSKVEQLVRKMVREYLRETTLTELTESSEQLDEKLITYGNRASYGQIVFVAGGAGSGKGFAIDKFLDSASFKIRDVDEMKKQIQKLNAAGKLSIDSILSKYSSSIKPKDAELIKKIKSDGFDLKSMNLRNPDHVYALHVMVKAIGIKDSSLAALLSGKSNPQNLPNILFDITAKEISDITSVLPMLLNVGYEPNNIHLTWVLTNYSIAIKQNAERDRVVPADILLGTHVGAGNTIWGIVTSALPRGMNGRIDVILNNEENTIYSIQRGTDSKTGKKKPVVSGFLSLPVKKQGGGIIPEKVWRDTLFNWIKQNGPKELTANFE